MKGQITHDKSDSNDVTKQIKPIEVCINKGCIARSMSSGMHVGVLNTKSSLIHSHFKKSNLTLIFVYDLPASHY